MQIEKTFEIELPDGSHWGVTATATQTPYMYGEDADNRRGEKRFEIEDIRISDPEMGRLKNAIEKALDNLSEEEWEVED